MRNIVSGIVYTGLKIKWLAYTGEIYTLVDQKGFQRFIFFYTTNPMAKQPPSGDLESSIESHQAPAEQLASMAEQVC